MIETQGTDGARALAALHGLEARLRDEGSLMFEVVEDGSIALVTSEGKIPSAVCRGSTLLEAIENSVKVDESASKGKVWRKARCRTQV